MRKYSSFCLERLFLCLCHSSSKYTLISSAHTTTMICSPHLYLSVYPRPLLSVLFCNKLVYLIKGTQFAFFPSSFWTPPQRTESGTDWENPLCTIWSKIAILRICLFLALPVSRCVRRVGGTKEKAGRDGGREEKTRSEQKVYLVYFFRSVLSFLLTFLNANTQMHKQKQITMQMHLLIHNILWQGQGRCVKGLSDHKVSTGMHIGAFLFAAWLFLFESTWMYG